MVTTYTECAMQQEFLELQIQGIPMVMIVTSRARSLQNPTQQNLINEHTLSIHKYHACFKFKRTLQSTL